MRNLTTRLRIVLLIIAAALPALALSIYGGLERRAAAVQEARRDLELFAAQMAREETQTIEGVRQLLVALAQPAESLIRTPESCMLLFKRIVEASKGTFHAIGIHSAQGVLVCNSDTWTTPIDVNDRRYFRLAIDHNQFAIGGYQIGRTTDAKGVNFAHPIRRDDGTIPGVVFAVLNLENLNRLASTAPMPVGGMLTLFDHDGTILARNPESAGRIGEKARNPAVVDAIRRGRNIEFDAADTSNVPRMFAFRAIGANPDGKAAFFLLVSIPKETLLAKADLTLKQTVAGILIATSILLVLAWYGAELVVLGKIRTMLNMTRRIQDGDLSARTGFQASREELSRLGASLDRMAESLERRDVQLHDALHQLGEQAITDALTGLYNRRFLWTFLERELLRSERAGTPVSVILLDLDDFKRVNDTWGHEAGDLVLRRVAEAIRRNVRGSDVAIRTGGEEVLVVLPATAQDVAMVRAETIRREFETMPLEYDGRPISAVTASFGIAVFPDHADDAEGLVRAADEAMYQAKQGGRNRIAIFQRHAPTANDSVPSGPAAR